MTTTGSCDCGAVTLVIAHAPSEVTSCNCTICHRLGTLWAYYPPAEVQITGPTVTYLRGDRMIALHHCATCGCTTHWSPLKADLDRMGINVRLFEPEVLAAARVRKIDGRSDTWTVLDE